MSWYCRCTAERRAGRPVTGCFSLQRVHRRRAGTARRHCPDRHREARRKKTCRLMPPHAVIRKSAVLRHHRDVVRGTGTGALCNVAEFSAGVMTEAAVPPGIHWIPRGMTVEDRGYAACGGDVGASILAAEAYPWPVTVEVGDVEGDRVSRTRITMWLSPSARRPRRQRLQGFRRYSPVRNGFCRCAWLRTWRCRRP